LGFRFAPRIRDLATPSSTSNNADALKPMIGGTLNIKHVRAHWDEIGWTSIKQGTVTASLMLRKLGGYPPDQNAWPSALRELGRHRARMFILDWLQSVELRPPCACRAERGEARNRWPAPCSSTAWVKSATAA
jgi:TnpA family transposase